jgi:hypothetical protein
MGLLDPAVRARDQSVLGWRKSLPLFADAAFQESLERARRDITQCQMHSFGFPAPAIGGMRLWNLMGVVRRWCRDLSAAEFKVVVYIFRWAADTPDGVVRRPRKEIAQATGIRMRDIRPMLKGLGARGVFEVMSLDREETVVRVGREHWSASLPPAAASEGKRPATVANLKEVLLRLTGIRVGVREVEELKSVAQVDDPALMEILDSLLRRGFRYQGLGLLTAAVLHESAIKRGRVGFW